MRRDLFNIFCKTKKPEALKSSGSFKIGTILDGSSGMSKKMSDFLLNKFNELKKSNSRYSVRSFAVKAGVSSGAMSEVLNHKRKLSKQLAFKIAENLKLNPTERFYFLADFMPQADVRPKNVRYLSHRQFSSISDSVYFTFLALMETVNFRNDPDWIAQKLRLTPDHVTHLIYRLKQLDILTEENGILIKTKELFSSSDDIKDEFVQKSHLDSLKSAAQSLLKDPVEARDFTSFSFPVDPQLLPQVKEKIRLFQDEIADMFRDKKNTAVFKLAIQFFPQTQILENDEEHEKSKVTS